MTTQIGERVDSDPLAHLFDYSVRGLTLGLGLAICSVVALTLAGVGIGSITTFLFAAVPNDAGSAYLVPPAGEPTLAQQASSFLSLSVGLYMLILLHTVFIAVLAARLLDGSKSSFRHLMSRDVVVNSGKLALCFLPFVLLDIYSSSYRCADGKAYDVSAIPMLPWLWIGWLILNALGSTARFGVSTALQVHRRDTIFDRVFAMAIFTIPVFLFGFVFQMRRIDCTPPFDGFGLFEGGIVLIPLLAAFWFFMSASSAIIAAVCAAPPVVISVTEGVD